MKNLWVEFYTGIVTVKITGQGAERLLNQLTRNGIGIWQVKRPGIDTITFKMRLVDAKKVRPFVRASNCRLKFIHREGMPFLLKRLWKNSGFLFGALGFLFVLFLLSNMVWGIEIKGAKPDTEYKIRKQLDKMGVKIGKVIFFIGEPEKIQREITDNIQAITWIGVELKGTTYHFQVVEKKQPQPAKVIGPQHLIATKKATIVDMFVEEGQPLVRVHDVVQPGQLIVSGLIGKEGQTEIVSAKGKVFGETWRLSEAEQSLKTTFSVFSGKEKRRHYIKISKLNIPIWGFGKRDFTEYETEEAEHKVRLLKWELPISYTVKTEREREQAVREYTNEQAIEEAKKSARKEVKGHLGEDDYIKGEKILHQVTENGKVRLYIHFQIVENIAEGQPIIQGD